MVVQESGFEEEEEGYGDESAGYDEAGCLNLYFFLLFMHNFS